MALDPEFVNLLRCPETKEPVAVAAEELLASLNLKIRRGELRDRAGRPVRKELHGGLLRRDGKLLYPVWDDLPDMLIPDSIPLHDPEPEGSDPAPEA